MHKLYEIMRQGTRCQAKSSVRPSVQLRRGVKIRTRIARRLRAIGNHWLYNIVTDYIIICWIVHALLSSFIILFCFFFFYRRSRCSGRAEGRIKSAIMRDVALTAKSHYYYFWLFGRTLKDSSDIYSFLFFF